MRYTLIQIEHNGWNGFFAHVLEIDHGPIYGALIGISFSRQFLYISLFFINVKIFDKTP